MRRKGFAELTVVSGIPALGHLTADDSRPWRKALWTGVIILGVGLTVVQVERVLSEYAEYPVTTRVTVNDSAKQKFPAVTICPMAAVKCARLIDAARTCWAGKCESSKLFCDLAVSTGCYMSALVGEESESVAAIEKACEAPTIPEITDTDALIEFYKNDFFLEKYANLSYADRIAIGSDPDEVFKKCHFGQKTCSQFFDIKTINNIVVGNCFTLNAKGEMGDRANGPGSGLNAYLYLSLMDMPWIPFNDREGVRVAIHDPGEIPVVNERGLDVMPGTSTRFALEVREFQRQPAPYTSRCVADWTEVNIPHVENFTAGYNYSQSTCLRQCSMFHDFSRCGCISPILDEFNVRDATGIDYCDQRHECEENVGETFAEALHVCGCGPACNQREYDAIVTASKWPSYVAWMFTAKDMGLADFEISDVMSDNAAFESKMEALRQDIVHIQVYFKTTRTSLNVEEKKYPDLLSLFTNLGGALSVWMGFSFLILIEVVELGLEYASEKI